MTDSGEVLSISAWATEIEVPTIELLRAEEVEAGVVAVPTDAPCPAHDIGTGALDLRSISVSRSPRMR